MTAKIIDGKEFSENLRKDIAVEVAKVTAKTGKTPGLAVILVGADPASQVYVASKGKKTKEVGMESFQYLMDSKTSQEILINKIEELNADENVNGILVQLPLPKHIDENSVIAAISPEKDVDGFHVINSGLLATAQDGMVPCTPLGCVKLIEDVVDDLAGKHAVIIGRSNIVGKPVSQLLLNKSCTVTICHSRTQNIQEITKQADILIAAVGRPNMVKAGWVKPGAVVIDVGINRLEPTEPDGKGRLVGDVDFEDVSQVAAAITPVPGGVGPMTIACLLQNTLQAFCKHNDTKLDMTN